MNTDQDQVVLFRWGQDLLQGEAFVQHGCQSCSCSWQDVEDPCVRLEGTYYDIQSSDILRDDEKQSLITNKHHESMKVNGKVYLCCQLNPTHEFKAGHFFDYPLHSRRAVILTTDVNKGVLVYVVGTKQEQWLSWESAKHELHPLGSKIPRADYERALVLEELLQKHAPRRQ